MTMRSPAVLGCALLLGACTSKTQDKAPPAASGSAVPAKAGSAASSGSGTAPGSGSGSTAVPVVWERQDLSKLAIPLPVTVEVPPGVSVEPHKVAYGNGDTPVSTIDLVGPGWTMNLEPLRDKEPPTAAAAIRGRALTPEMVVTSKDLPDGGWLVVWKQPTQEHFMASVRKTANVVCDSSGPLKAEHVETVLKLCDSIQPSR